MGIVNHIRHNKKISELLQKSEMPATISLALSGIAVQIYASYNLIKSENGARLRIPFFNYQMKESTNSA